MAGWTQTGCARGRHPCRRRCASARFNRLLAVSSRFGGDDPAWTANCAAAHSRRAFSSSTLRGWSIGSMVMASAHYTRNPDPTAGSVAPLWLRADRGAPRWSDFALLRSAKVKHDTRGCPLPRSALRFRYLFGSHLRREELTPPVCFARSIGQRSRALRRGEIEPHMRGHVVLRDTSTSVVQSAKVGLRVCIPLVGSPLVPPSRSRMILGYTLARIVQEAEHKLGHQMVLFSGTLEPFGRGHVVLRRAPANEIR